MRRKILSMLLVLTMCIGMMPGGALAADITDSGQAQTALQDVKPKVEQTEKPTSESSDEDNEAGGEIKEAPDEAVSAVQELLNALPGEKELSAMDSEKLNEVYNDLQAANDAYLALNAEQQAAVTGTEKFESLFGWYNAQITPMDETLPEADTVATVTVGNETINCTTLENALNEANGKNATVTLLKDTNEPTGNTMSLDSGNITLDLNGLTGYFRRGSSPVSGNFIDVCGAELTVKNGTLKGLCSTSSANLVNMSSGKFVLESTASLVAEGYSTRALYMNGGEAVTYGNMSGTDTNRSVQSVCKIYTDRTGGILTVNGGIINGGLLGGYANNGKTAVLNGGSFDYVEWSGYYDTILGTDRVYKDNTTGNDLTEISGSNVTNVSVVPSVEASVTIGNTTTKYRTLNSALEAINTSDAATITLLYNVTLDEPLNIGNGGENKDIARNITLDLKGCTLAGKGWYTLAPLEGTKLTVVDSSDTHSGQVVNISVDGSAIDASDSDPDTLGWTGTLTITGGTFIGTGENIALYAGDNGNKVSLAGGTYINNDTYYSVYADNGVGVMLKEGYAYRQTEGNKSWITVGSNVRWLEEEEGVTVQPIPVRIKDQTTTLTPVNYGYTESQPLSVTAEAVTDKGIDYQWYKGTEIAEDDSNKIADATSASYEIPAGLGIGETKYFCAVRCDGYQLTTDVVTFTVNQGSQNTLNITGKPENIHYGDVFTLDTTGGSGTGDITWSVKSGTAASVDETTGEVKATGVGEVVITAVKAADDNYMSTFTDINLNITERIAELSWTGTDLIYNGKNQKPNATVSNLVANDTCEVTVTGEQTDKGTHLASAAELSNANYILPDTATQEFTISYLTAPEQAYTISGTEGADDWYTSDVTLTPAAGYTVSTTLGGNYTNTLIISESVSDYKIYLRNADGQMTDAITVGNIKIDKEQPTGTISVGTKSWTSFLNNVTFGHFFKETQNVTVTANEQKSETTIQLLKSNTKYTNQTIASATGWEDGSSISISPNYTGYVYAKITSGAGLVSYLNTDGLIIYKDAAASTTEVVYTKTTQTDTSAVVTLNGNTIEKVSIGNAGLTTEQCTVADNILTLKGAYLDTLTAGDYTVKVSYNPMGETYVAGDRPSDTTFTLKVQKSADAVTSIADLSKMYDGAAVAAVYTCLGTGKASVTYYQDNEALESAPKNAGSYTVKVEVEADDNYAADEMSKDFTISAKTLTASMVSQPSDVTYNGSAQKPTVTVADETFMTVNDYELEYKDNTDAGTATLIVKAKGNYSGTETKNFTVKSKTLTITANKQNKHYGEEDPTLTYAANGLEPNDTITGKLSRAEGEIVGDYNILVGTLSAGKNYQLSYSGAKLSIEKADAVLNVSVSPASQMAGKDVTITVTAKNAATETLVSGTAQPAFEQIKLTAPAGTTLKTDLHQTAPGTFEAIYTVNDDATPGEAGFKASMEASDYYNAPEDAIGTLTVTDKNTVKLNITTDKSSDIAYGDSVTYTVEVAKDHIFSSTLDGTVTLWLGEPDLEGSEKIASGDADEKLIATLNYSKLTAGSHTIYAAYSGNDNFSAAQTNVVTVVAKKQLTWNTDKLTADKDFDSNSDADVSGELTVNGIVEGDNVNFTYTSLDGSFADGKPGKSKNVTVTVTGAAVDSENYLLPEDNNFVITADIAGINTLPTPVESTENKQLMLEVTDGISEVPEELKNNAELDTPEKIETIIKVTIEKELGNTANIKLMDVNLLFSTDGGKTWEKATAENFPAGGITVEVPFSMLGISYEQAKNMNFFVTHMFGETANGHVAGEVEHPDWSLTENGIKFVVTGLSPIAIGYTERAQAPSDTNNGKGDAGADSGKAPMTGDNTNMTLYVLLMLISGCVVIGMTIAEKKRRRNSGN